MEWIAGDLVTSSGAIVACLRNYDGAGWSWWVGADRATAPFSGHNEDFDDARYTAEKSVALSVFALTEAQKTINQLESRLDERRKYIEYLEAKLERVSGKLSDLEEVFYESFCFEMGSHGMD